MIEQFPHIPISAAEPMPKYATEWRLPGCEEILCGVDPTKSQHVESAVRIEIETNPDEFAEVDRDPTIESIIKWLGSASGNINRGPFTTDSLGRQTPARIIQGVKETVIAVGETPDGIADWVYLYHRTPQEREVLAHAGLSTLIDDIDKPPQRLELSYSHTRKSPAEMADAVLQVAAKVMQRIAEDNSPDARLSADQIESVNKKLILFAQAGTGDDEIEYRKGLELAGAKLVGYAPDSPKKINMARALSSEGPEYANREGMNYVYVFKPEDVQRILREKQASVSK